jgi:hypothetical protein
MRRSLAPRSVLVGTIVLALMTLVVVPPAAAKNVTDRVDVMGSGARAGGGGGCTDDVPEPGDRVCTNWGVQMFAGISHMSWDTENESMKPEVCAGGFIDRYDASSDQMTSTWRMGCINGQHLSLEVAKDLSSASADATIPTITATCDQESCTPEVPGEPLVLHIEWVGVGQVTSEKWKQTSDQGGGCYSIESLDGDARSATATGTIDGVSVVADDLLNTDMWRGHHKYQLVCPE